MAFWSIWVLEYKRSIRTMARQTAVYKTVGLDFFYFERLRMLLTDDVFLISEWADWSFQITTSP